MTHTDAQREVSVERYLLGELQGDVRDEFEDHLFDCEICSADLQTGMAFTEGIKAGGPQLVAKPVFEPAWSAPAPPASVSARKKVSGWAASLLQPWIAAPALAACMAVICVQSFVIQPRLHREIAAAEMPSVVSPVVLKGAVRGLETAGGVEVQAHRGGRFSLAFDIPAAPGFRFYRCTLVSPHGKPVWHTDLSPAQSNDRVTIDVAVGATAPGINTLKVEGIPQTDGNQAVLLRQSRFNLRVGE